MAVFLLVKCSAFISLQNFSAFLDTEVVNSSLLNANCASLISVPFAGVNAHAFLIDTTLSYCSRLFDKQKQYEDVCDKVELLETQLSDSKSNISNLEEILEEKREDIET